MDEQRKYAILFAATIFWQHENSAKLVSSPARSGNVPSLTTSLTQHKSLRGLANAGLRERAKPCD